MRGIPRDGSPAGRPRDPETRRRTHKACARCYRVKKLSEFYAGNPRKGDGHGCYCKVCAGARRRERLPRTREHVRKMMSNPANRHKRLADVRARRAANPEAFHEYNIKSKYGITLEEYTALLRKQGGGCAVCGARKDPRGTRLSVDHDHTTKIVRGILCAGCNSAIGRLGDNPSGLLAAHKYTRSGPRLVTRLIKSSGMTGLDMRYSPWRTWRGYEVLLNAQGGVCKLCGSSPNTGRRLAVDHCHLTGEVRGLLCNGCNAAVGRLGDSADGLMKAYRYLRKASK